MHAEEECCVSQDKTLEEGRQGATKALQDASTVRLAGIRLTRMAAQQGVEAHFGAGAAGHRGVWDMDLAQHVHDGFAREIGRVLHHALAHCLVIHEQDGLQSGEGPLSTAQVDPRSSRRLSTASHSWWAAMLLSPWLGLPVSDAHSVPDHLASQSQPERMRLR